jgi:hypothetical protein|tara:strand:- start:64 stop:342 length:279 start_codon:yes stop_codon:yes gene_type:complete
VFTDLHHSLLTNLTPYNSLKVIGNSVKTFIFLEESVINFRLILHDLHILFSLYNKEYIEKLFSGGEVIFIRLGITPHSSAQLEQKILPHILQ